MTEDDLIDRVMDRDPDIFYDEAEIEVRKLKKDLAYFDLKIDNLYCKD
jgi:hypothetical protein